MRWILAWVVLHSTLVLASRLTPPVLPLVVRNPYLSTWLPDARHNPWAKWPFFWTGQSLGLGLMAHVPSTGNVYPLLGRHQDSLGENKPEKGYNVTYPTFLGSHYDASTTNLSYSIPLPSGGDVKESLELTISFLSPITPTSTLRQSIPASYVTIYVKGNVNVNIYMDVNGQWVSGHRGSLIEWKFDHITAKEEENNLYRWQVSRKTEQHFTEHQDRSEWGTLHFIAPSSQDVRYESGTSGELRKRFARTGVLQNVNDKVFRSIMDNEPVFAFSKAFGLNGTADQPNMNITENEVTFTVAHIQDPVVQFASARGLTLMKPLYASWFRDADQLLIFHYFDLPKVRKLAQKYSSELAKDAYLSGAEDYVDIVSLSARQVLGATQFSGTAENPILFLKEISSNGNCQTVDVIFPSFPFFLYTNPRWLAYLLEPLIEHMLSGQYPHDYSMHDLGAHYPNMTGHPDGKDEYMPVEECGNMLIMGLAVVNSLRYPPDDNGSAPWHPSIIESRGIQEDPGIFPLLNFQTVGGIDKLDSTWGIAPVASKQAHKWVERSYRLWKQWTGYLVEFSLEPHNQLSTDDFAGWLALQTNLALKGIVGINAMSELASFVENKEDASHYKNISDTYISKWEGFGMSRGKLYAKLAYDWFGSWTTLYNLFADAILCFHLDGTKHDMHKQVGQKPLDLADKKSIGFVPRHIYSLQSKWYFNVRQKYGLPLDSRHLYAKTDWEFFAMAVSSPSVRHDILESVALWVNDTVTDRPLTDLHKTEGDGGFPGPNFFARPVVGGHFAFLALEKACKGKATDGLDFLNGETIEMGPPIDNGAGCYGEHCRGSGKYRGNDTSNDTGNDKGGQGKNVEDKVEEEGNDDDEEDDGSEYEDGEEYNEDEDDEEGEEDEVGYEDDTGVEDEEDGQYDYYDDDNGYEGEEGNYEDEVDEEDYEDDTDVEYKEGGQYDEDDEDDQYDEDGQGDEGEEDYQYDENDDYQLPLQYRGGSQVKMAVDLPDDDESRAGPKNGDL